MKKLIAMLVLIMCSVSYAGIGYIEEVPWGTSYHLNVYGDLDLDLSQDQWPSQVNILSGTVDVLYVGTDDVYIADAHVNFYGGDIDSILLESDQGVVNFYCQQGFIQNGFIYGRWWDGYYFTIEIIDNTSFDVLNNINIYKEVPEPASIGMLAIGALFLCRKK